MPAWQDNPGSQTYCPKWRKGVIAMEKNKNKALVIIGWFIYIIGSLVETPIIIKLISLSAARPLP